MEIDPDQLQEQINKAKSGNQIAYNTLLDSYWNAVYGFQLKKTQNESDAEDITIQTFAKAFNKIDTFDPSYSFKTWLIAISKNIHVDLLRKRNSSIRSQTTHNENAKVYSIVDNTPTIEDVLITEQNLAQLLQDIKQLQPHYQEVINLRYFMEMSYKEIADQLEEPMDNIKVKLFRAKKLLAKIIKDRSK